tara:strand:+ start:15813 stop:16256 length:444 start_codon:yes stop_codon:yes gene_type:complete
VKVSRQIAVFLLLLTLALSPPLLLGDLSAKSLPGVSEEAGDKFFLGVLKVVGLLMLLGAMAYFATDFFRNRRLGRFKGDRSKRLRVADVCALGNRQFVFVIECEGQRHLVGAWTTGIRYLSPLPGTTDASFENQLSSQMQSVDEEED